MSDPNAVFESDSEDSKLRYSIVPHSLIRDETISPNCRWLVIYLCSNAPNWRINARQIINHCANFMGRDQVYKVIQEAIEAGYLQRSEKTVKGLKRITYYVSSDKKFKKCLPRPEIQDTAAQDTADQDAKVLTSVRSIKEKKEISKDISLVSPEVETLKKDIFDEIKKAKGDYTKQPTKNWDQKAKALLKLRSHAQIMRILKWALQDDFWRANVLSPNGLFNNLDMIEAKMGAKPSEDMKRELAEKHEIEARKHDNYGKQRGGEMIIASRDHVEFVSGPNCREVPYNISDAEWQERTGWFSNN